MTTNLLNEDVQLERLLSGPLEVENGKIEELDRLIESLGGLEGNNALSMEKKPLDVLRCQRAEYTYPELDTSFLAAHNILDVQGQDIQVPKFSIYKLYGNNRFEVNFHLLDNWVGFFTRSFSYHFSTWSGGDYLPVIFTDWLARSTEFFNLNRSLKKEYSNYKFELEEYPRKTREKLKEKYGEETKLTSEFYGILPAETKEKAKDAEKIFRKPELYIIRETKPEEWNVRRIPIGQQDPLLVGVITNKCFLIDGFDTTPLENYVRAEFTK